MWNNSLGKLTVSLTIIFLLFNQFHSTNSLKYGSRKAIVNSDIIDEVDSKKLEKLIEDEETVGLFIYPRSCEAECQNIVTKLESINDQVSEMGIFMLRNSERAVAKKYDIHKIPALVYFKHNRDPIIYPGNLNSPAEQMVEWFDSIKSLDLPDKIEEITSKNLQDIIDSYDYVAILWYENNCKKCERVLQELEQIDDEADEKSIGFFKIQDRQLAFEYGLETLPALVYYRKKIPIVYTDSLEEEEKVLEWLLEFRDTVEQAEESDESIIEDVNSKVLQALIQNTDNLAVLFYDANSRESQQVLNELENVDDECDAADILLVKIDDKALAKSYGIDMHEMPALVYFESQVPNFYNEDLKNEEKLLEWLIQQKNSDEIETVTAEVFQKMLDTNDKLAVIFFESSSVKSSLVLEDLENIDDDCDKLNLPLLKIDDEELAAEFGVADELPALIYFEHNLPSIYSGDLRNEDKVLKWLQTQLESDEIEQVNQEILEDLIEDNDHVVVLFLASTSGKTTTTGAKTKGSSSSKGPSNEQVLEALESIDDECDAEDILLIKTDELDILKEHDIPTDKLPLLVYFEDEVPHIYEGDLTKKNKVLDWIIAQKESETIENVNSKTLQTMIKDDEPVAVLFYDKDSKESEKVLNELENIDDECDDLNVNFVKIDDDHLARSYGLMDELPILVYFEKELPTIYEGKLTEEEEVLAWITKQVKDDTIEEVTEEILEKLIEKNSHVLVFFAPNNCKECDKILHELENIDDDTDGHGIIFVTTDDLNLAKNKYKIKKFPCLVLFQDEDDFSVYDGNLEEEDDVLEWVTSVDVLDNPDEIEVLNEKGLNRLLDRSEFVVVLFIKETKCKQCEQVKEELEKIDHEVERNDVDFVMINSERVAKEFGVTKFPTIVFFNQRFPQFFDGKDILDENEVYRWIIEQKNSDKKENEIELVSEEILRVLIDDLPSIAVLFTGNEKKCETCNAVIRELETIDDESYSKGIHFVKCDSVAFAKELDITKFPSLVYFEDSKPSIYTEDLEDEDAVLNWLITQKTEDTIEEINRAMLFKQIVEYDYLAVFFYKDDDDESDEILQHLELIDDDCSEFEVHLVKIADDLIAKKYGVRNPPGLVLFRRQKPIKFDGNLFDEMEVLDWLTKVENMDSEDAIERVNKKMFERLLSKVNYLAVLFYSKDDCKQCDSVINELEKIDDDANAENVKMVKIDDQALGKQYGVHALPALLFFKKGDENPIIFAGDLKKSNKILDWLISQKDPDIDRIEEVDADLLKDIINKEQYVVVYFYSEECEDCAEILEALETIDTETDKHGVSMVKIKDQNLANYYGCRKLPSIIYFEEKVPSIYQDELTAESVLQWILEQRSDSRIEEVNREILEHMVDNTHYLVVLFYKPNCRACDIVLEELEHIDDECSAYGVNMVKIQDVQLAKRYAIRTFPALMYFRNGNPLLFDGDLRNEDEVLEWLIDDDNRELQDEIEHVNGKMLEKLVQKSPFLVVYFYSEDCDDDDDNCAEILEKLEELDDELDHFGIDFVKVNDPEAISNYRINHLPSLVYFRKRSHHAYDGDLMDQKKLLSWLTSEDVFELKDEIEEVNRKMLDKFLNENEFIAVYFYNNDCAECEEVLKELENIDDEANDLQIMFVKIRDLRYAKKYGIVSMPSLVFFRKKFPSLYRGDLSNEEAVLEWLKKNRYRHPEISIFMYGLILVTGGFIFYTLFLIFFMKPKEKKE